MPIKIGLNEVTLICRLRALGQTFDKIGDSIGVAGPTVAQHYYRVFPEKRPPKGTRLPAIKAGERFGRWTVLRTYVTNKKTYKTGFSSTYQRGTRFCVCVCDCGTKRTVLAISLRRGDSKSCDCLKRELFAKRIFHHGLTKTIEYSIWHNMRQSCNNPRAREYAHNGARGIKVCARWNGKGLFQNFFKDMGPRPSKKHLLDRKDMNGDYSPKNCKWNTRAGQIREGKHIRNHGLSDGPEYRAWHAMRNRCNNPNNPDYGGRGVKVCERWAGSDCFLNFYRDMRPRPSDKHSLDRIDPNGDYSPENCRWGTAYMQRMNQRKVIEEVFTPGDIDAPYVAEQPVYAAETLDF
ncbi:MAG TPA: hypothetical protein VMI32_07065 [Candidatus Solibacter sp.]|nr:hypothetical protein [Candidatus Solibacter sp.]